MSRPGSWARVFTNLRKYLVKDWSDKIVIGEDSVGNKFYEIRGSRQNVARGFEPAPGRENLQPSIEWQSWLKGTRRFPPNEDEIAFNRLREQQQAQLQQNLHTEKRAPHVQSQGPGAGPPTDGPKAYPKYEDYEQAPGYQTPGQEPKPDKKKE